MGGSGRGRRARRRWERLEVLEDRRLPTTFIVNSLADNGVGSGNAGDLRYVIERADALHTGTAMSPDQIVFSGLTITPADHTIRVGSGSAGAVPLPALTDPAVVDGTSAVGYNNLTGLLLTIDGSALHGGGNGLILDGGNSVVEALQIVDFPGNGLLVRSSGNTIGGSMVGLNANGDPNNPAGRMTSPLPPSPVSPVVVRPPQGNVISGNGGDGILIEGGGSNVLEGNFVGTDIAGTAPQGNGGDGVALMHSNGDMIYGTTPPDQNNPFVYYNVVSGNRRNGLLVHDSNGTIIYANFFGLGADNQTGVGNGGDGVLINGTSDQTTFGANIPLGSVAAANGKNGVEVAGTATRTILANTFAGVAAFNPYTPVGNHRDGILVRTAGRGAVFGASKYSTIILTCQTSGNGRDGIEIARKAARVQVSQSVIGLQTNGHTPEANGYDGIEIHGGTHAIAIGGFEPSVAGVPESAAGVPTGAAFLEAANVISGNRNDGISIEGCARGIRVVNSFIGTDIAGTGPASNGGAGIAIAQSSHDQIGAPIGDSAPRDRNIIAFNAGPGVQVRLGVGNSILGNPIFSNGGPGISLLQGGNHGQSAPVLASATNAPNGMVQITGSISGRPHTTYQVELFAGPSGSPGQGQTVLGSLASTTNARGLASFTFDGPLTSPGAETYFTATATSSTGDTSMFSRAVVLLRPLA